MLIFLLDLKSHVQRATHDGGGNEHDHRKPENDQNSASYTIGANTASFASATRQGHILRRRQVCHARKNKAQHRTRDASGKVQNVAKQVTLGKSGSQQGCDFSEGGKVPGVTSEMRAGSTVESAYIVSKEMGE